MRQFLYYAEQAFYGISGVILAIISIISFVTKDMGYLVVYLLILIPMLLAGGIVFVVFDCLGRRNSEEES